MEAAADALQVAGLQAGHLRRALTDMMADVATLHAALERARTALQAERQNGGGSGGCCE